MEQNQESNLKKGEFGRIFFEWRVPEYTLHERTRTWYIVMALIGLGLVIHSIVYTANYLFALIIILATFIIYLRLYYAPKDLLCQITEDGIIVGNQFFGYELLQNFYIIYYPPAIKKLFFRRKGINLSDISVPLDKINPVVLRQQLLIYLDEDLEKEHQSAADLIEMLFKL